MKSCRGVLPFFLALALTSTGSAGWYRTTGAYGGTISRIALWKGSLVAACRNNIYVQKEPGVWTRLGKAGESAGSQGYSAPRMVFAMGEVLFTVTDSSLMAYDTLSGTWTRKGIVRGGEITPYGPNLVMLGPSNRLMLSPDSGRTWIVRDQPLQCGGTLHPHGKLLFASTGIGIYVSSDTGTTWEAAGSRFSTPPGDPGLPLVNSTLCYDYSSLVFRGTEMVACALQYGWVRTSVDSGRTWTYRGSTGYLGQFSTAERLAAIDSTLLATGSYGVYRSTDNGRNFTNVYPGGGTGQLLVAGPLIYLTNSRLLCSRDTGLTWTPVGIEGLEELPCSELHSDGSSVFARMGYFGGLFRARDTVGYWEPVTNFPSHDLAVWPERMFSVTPSGLYISFDRGATWGFRAGSTTLPVYVGSTCFAFASPEGTSLLKSTDDGFTWSVLPPAPSRYSLYSAAGALYSVAYDSNAYYLWTSTDLGTTWGRIPSRLPNYANQFIGFRSELYLLTYNAVYRSLDGGVSWGHVDSLSETDSWFSRMAADSLRLVVSSTRQGRPEVKWTGGYGYPWVSFGQELPWRSAVNAFCLTRHTLYAGTEADGIWGYSLSGLVPVLSVGEQESPLPVAFALDQNYPNPFNPTTTIRYRLPHRARVLLTVYTMLGQQIAELVDEELGPGTHEVRFDGSDLASGVYFCRLQAGGYAQVRQILLLR